MPEAVIVDAIRTPIGRAVKGSLRSVRADDLGAIPLRALIERNPALEQTSATTSGACPHCWPASITTCRRAR